MSRPTPTRPRQVTLAAWLIMVGSAIVVAMVFDRIGGLHTLETRESVESFLAEPPGADLGIDVDGAITVLRVVSMIAAGCATAAAILGYQVLRRSRSARLALTVLAIPLFLTGIVTGGFVSSVVAASAVMLWLQPSRSWFAGETPAVPASPAARPAARPTTPPAHDPAAQPPAVQQQLTQPPQQPWPQQPTSATGVGSDRPRPVVAACALTWLASGLVALGLLLTAVVLAVDPDPLLDQVHSQRPDLAEQGVSDGMLIGASLAMSAVIVLWCVAAIVLAVLVYRRVEWARVTLLVSAGVSAVLSLVGLVAGGFLLVVPLAAAVGAFMLLVRSDARPWFQSAARG